MIEHDCYRVGQPDADAPDQIKDRNGTVVLRYCLRCRRAEAELSVPCTVACPATKTDCDDERWDGAAERSITRDPDC